MVILFRPFDLGKWFTIGFQRLPCRPFRGRKRLQRLLQLQPLEPEQQPDALGLVPVPLEHPQPLHDAFRHGQRVDGLYAGLGIFLIAIVAFFALGFILLIYWLGARGQFLFIDNVVRNRGAISWPWRAYARQGNDLFVFYLLWLLFVVALLVPFIVGGFFLVQPYVRDHRWPEGGEYIGFVLLGLLYFAISIPLGIILFLFRELGVPLMFRSGMTARAAFMEIGRLFLRHPGSLLIFVLLRLVLFIALVIVCVVTCCFTCCVEAIPYLGTVVLLPALIFIKCFTLDYLAQFGPEYDVWTTDVPPAPAAPVPAPSPLPPPG